MSAEFLHELDVTALEAPLPFERCVERLRTLGAGEVLRMIHRREPFPLYDTLARLGFSHRTTKPAAGLVHVLIWRAADELATARAQEL